MSRTPFARLGIWLACAGLLIAGCGSGATGAPEPGPTGGQLASTLAPSADGGDVTALITAAGLPACPAPAPAAVVPGGLPDTVLSCLGDGTPVRLSDLRGPLLINVWASWCGPCQAETPVLAAFADAYGDRVPVLGVDVGDTQAAALAAAARWGATFPSVQDPAEALKGSVRPPYVGPPATYLVRADGTVAPLILGEISGADQLVGALAPLGIALGAAT